MGSINKNHNETDGGVLLFNGELILIYCDSVNIEIGGRESSKGRIYLTTHRIIFVASPMKPNITVKSVSAPFFALSEIKLEQPVFGANYISARVRDESDQSQSFTFKLRFSKGGAIEFAMAMSKAANAVSQMYNSAQPPPVYTPSPSTQYYQAPPTVYSPGYNCGFQMPQSQHFNQPGAAPIGFIYASSEPPPYPGFSGTGPAPGTAPGAQNPGQPQGQAPSGQQYPGSSPNNPGGTPNYNQPQQGAYGQTPYGQVPYGQPPVQPPGYQPPQANSAQSGGYPPQGGYPSPGGYPPQGGYPPSGYPSQSAPQQPPPSYSASVPTSSSSEPAYPNLSGTGEASAPPTEWSTTPSFNPNWEDKKSK